jgi:hypothetical protein
MKKKRKAEKGIETWFNARLHKQRVTGSKKHCELRHTSHISKKK